MSAKNEYFLARVKALQEARGWPFDRAFQSVLDMCPDLMEGTVEGGFARTPTPGCGRLTVSAQELPALTTKAQTVPAAAPKKERMLLIRGSEGTWVE